MSHVNKLIKRMPSEQQSKPEQQSRRWKPETEKAVLGLFARFADLYGSLAQSKGLEIFRESNPNEYTREAQLWMMKLDDVDMEGMARGVENLEKQIEENSKNGVKSWPPSYPEFKGLCHKAEKKAAHKPHMPLPSPKWEDDKKIEAMKEFRGKIGL